MTDRNKRFFPQLSPMARAIANLDDQHRETTKWNREVFAKEDDLRKSAAEEKRARKAAKRLKERGS